MGIEWLVPRVEVDVAGWVGEVFPGANDGACVELRGWQKAKFFPEERKDEAECHAWAKRVCEGCGVKQECLRHAVTWPEEYGVWGGTTPDERTRMRRNKVKMAAIMRGGE